MDKIYQPQNVESKWYETWQRLGYFKPQGDGAPYCIMLPPPNVTGNLHMGHAFQQTLIDILIRYHRMNGKQTLWQCGTDHAGIATQMVVERQLEQQGTHRDNLGREKFVAAIWDWKTHSGNTITQQLRRLGTSMDWSRERFTLDDGFSKAVREVFIKLYNEKLIYRGKRLVNWDPVLLTAISDLEVISEEESGHLWHIRYPLKINGKESQLIVATTRPETMLGDVAVAVHPNDTRYSHLIGKQLILPLTERAITLIGDEHVDPTFGTGCVKITPAHDFNDYEIARRHKLPLINIFTENAKIIADKDGTIANIPLKYQGLDRYEARRQIIADLKSAGLLESVQAHTLMVPRGDRSHAAIEPYLTDQWYVKTKPLAAPAIAAVERGEVRFIPEYWAKTYFDWMLNVEDWCISRQLWWGHRIPAWYDPQGKIYVGHSEKEIKQQENLPDDTILQQDSGVLDTWFSSALWPFVTLGWPKQTAELEKFYPTQLLVTGFDIIFFWVARMIMMGLKITDQVPFKEVYIHGLVRDAEGKKMSKSKGNVLDPIDLIDGIELDELITKRTTGLMHPRQSANIASLTRKNFPNGIASYGTDALRFTFASIATQGRDISFDTGRIGGYRNFCNKLWNASRYVLISVADQPLSDADCSPQWGLAERWIATRLAHTIRQVSEQLQSYRFDLAAKSIYEFTLYEYCDWYLEFSKVTLSSDTASEAEKLATRLTLLQILEKLTRLAHPFIPFIS